MKDNCKFREVNVIGCEFLTDDLLFPVLKQNPKLKHIHISKCNLLTDKTPIALAHNCKVGKSAGFKLFHIIKRITTSPD